MPFVGYGVVPAAGPGRAARPSARRASRAGIGGYVGINAAALVRGDRVRPPAGPVPHRRRHAAVRAVPPVQTIPAMMLAHLTVAGLRRGRAHRRRRRLPAAGQPPAAADQPRRRRRRPTPDVRRAGQLRGAGRSIGLGAMVVLTPLGLLAPGGAFGEDAPGRPRPRASTTSTRVPTGLNSYAGFWSNTLSRRLRLLLGGGTRCSGTSSPRSSASLVIAASDRCDALPRRLARGRTGPARARPDST